MSTSTALVALITGGNKGLGLEIARQFGKKGITVVIGSRDAANGEKAVAKLKADGVNAGAVKLDRPSTTPSRSGTTHPRRRSTPSPFTWRMS